MKFSKEQMALFHQTKLEKICREIAEELEPYRPEGLDKAAFETWIEKRARAYPAKAKVEQKRHIHLLCFWEVTLGTERFAKFRNGLMKEALTSQGDERQRIQRARQALERFLQAHAA